jgi:hypothetical protein
MKAKRTAGGIALAAGAVVAGRCRRDLRRARARLARLERTSTETPFGPLEYCEWGEGEPLLLIHGVVGGATCRRHGARSSRRLSHHETGE